MSSNAVVTEKLCTTIEAIALDELGFAVENGNVRRYLPPYHDLEDLRNFFIAKVTDSKTTEQHRAWCVEVVSADFFFTTTQDRQVRSYDITILGFYDVLLNGEGFTLLAEHLSKVSQAILALTTNLGSTITRVTNIDLIKPSIIPSPASLSVERMLVAGFSIKAIKQGNL